jgi:hypothetical protein
MWTPDAISEAYLVAAASAAELLRDPAVAAAWKRPSALAEFQVSGLAGHLASQMLGVPAVLEVEPDTDVPISLAEHYARVPWVGAPVDAEVNVGVRASGEALAMEGPTALVSAVDEALAVLPALLAEQTPDRAVYLPWTGWALTFDDYLTSRMMEIAVHSDDLAVSVDTVTPPLPPGVTGPVFALLTTVAEQRHGTTAVLRALSRAERAPETITAF